MKAEETQIEMTRHKLRPFFAERYVSIASKFAQVPSYHIGRRAVLIVLEALQGHPAYGSVLVITETMVVLGEEISSQGGVSQSHAKTGRFDQAISGRDVPENELSALSAFDPSNEIPKPNDKRRG